MLRCSECQKSIIPETKYAAWLSLINTIEFLLLEKYIEPELAEQMTDNLMKFKMFVEDDDYDS